MPSLRTRLSVAALLLFSLVSVGTIGVTSEVAPAAAAVAPTRTISVSGTGVAMYPAFSATTTRYGITTTALTAGTVTVDASTSDPAGRVWVDGQPEVGGTATLTGLSSGAEISIFIKDSAGTTAYALIYLPVGFPAMTATRPKGGLAPGDVFLTLSDFTGTTPSYETVVDNNGVPVYVRTDISTPTDFTRQPDGNYSVYRPETEPAGTFGGVEVELNDKFQQVGAYQTLAPLVDTDGHDFIRLSNGDAWLLSTVPNNVTRNTDDVIQEQSPNGTVLFQWSTEGVIDPVLDGLSGLPDYAHINSIALAANGDIIASMRDTSQVVDIATSAHDGFTPGQIVWTLGGRRPTLKIIDPADDPFNPDTGPCGQHDVTVLPNGHILMFDDGSEPLPLGPQLCVDPANPTSGAAIAREQTRVAEYSINQSAKTATLVWSYEIPGRDASFIGSAERMANGDTFIGWGGTHAALASEVDAKGQSLWELQDGGNLISYRAMKFVVPDAIHPAVVVSQPADGATYAFGQHVSNSFSCTDRGGSTLQSCAGSVAEGGPINTSWPGTHTFTVVAKDGAGNTTTVTRTYHVGPAPYQPDAQIKAAGAGAFKGNNTYAYAGVAKQDIKQTIAKAGKSAVATVRIQNDGTRTDRITLHGTAGTAKFRVSYFVGTANVTKRVTAGTYKTPSLASGKTFTLRITVTRTAKAKPGTSRTVTLSGTSAHDPSMHDSVATIVRAIR